MKKEYVFSWAENTEGKMVHVDSVSRGLRCECTCLLYTSDVYKRQIYDVRIVG